MGLVQILEGIKVVSSLDTYSFSAYYDFLSYEPWQHKALTI